MENFPVIILIVIVYIWLGSYLSVLSAKYDSAVLSSVGNAASFTGGFMIFAMITYYILPNHIFESFKSIKETVAV
jgi:hypothetical protein